MMEKHNVKRLPVMRGEKLVGIVSRSNLLQAVASLARQIPDPTADDDHIRNRIIDGARQERLVSIGPQRRRPRRHRASERRHYRRTFEASRHRLRGEYRRGEESPRPSVLGRSDVRAVLHRTGRRGAGEGELDRSSAVQGPLTGCFLQILVGHLPESAEYTLVT